MKLFPLIARPRVCRRRHRFSHWAHVRREHSGGNWPKLDWHSQFRMCRDCGAQETREVVCE